MIGAMAITSSQGTLEFTESLDFLRQQGTMLLDMGLSENVGYIPNEIAI